MKILLRKIGGVFDATIGGTWYRTASAAPSSLADTTHTANLLAASWLLLLAPVVALLWALAVAVGAIPAASVAFAPSSLTVDSLSMISVAGTINALYDTVELTGVVNSMKALVNGIHATFFQAVKTSDSEVIAFDVDDKKRYRAPYVHPKAAGKPQNLRGFNTNTFAPAYIKQLTVVDPERPLKRAMGEALLGERTPQQRLDDAVAQELSDHREYVDRRLEEQAVSALLNGSITVTGDDYPETIVNFGRDTTLNLAANSLAGASRWDQSGSDPLKTLRNWSKKASKASGSILRNFIMDSDAYDAFRGNAKVGDSFNVLRIDPGSINTNLAQTEGLILRGECDGHLIWTYDGWYTDEAGVDQELFTGGIVLGVGGIDGVTHYGAIKDFKAGMRAVPIFAKAWEEENPSGLQLLTQSAPLVVPRRINASLAGKVLGAS
jgi:hypothetical protein